jgi:inhibitor of cysteine peptidase
MSGSDSIRLLYAGCFPFPTFISAMELIMGYLRGFVMILNDQDSGRSFDASIGSLFSVRLMENPTTGYRWMIEKKDGFELESDSFEKASGATGSAGLRIFQFRALGTGLNKLKIKNMRDWEGERSVIDRFDVMISVK